MQQQLTIVREGLPARCEICHQADRFNRSTGECARCRHFTAYLKKAHRPAVVSHPDDASALQVFGALLLFAAHLYFLPNARALTASRTIAWALYCVLVVIGSMLLICGKHHQVIISYIVRCMRFTRLR